MTSSSFDTALRFAWSPDRDGERDHIDAHDPGGETNMGVTLATWTMAVEHGLVSGLLSQASNADLALVLRTYFWRACSCDLLPTGVDLVVFDMAMVSGPGRSARILQTVLGVEVDGDIGPHTLEIADDGNAKVIINRMTTQDEVFFKSLHTWTYFGRGWDARALSAQAAALALIGG